MFNGIHEDRGGRIIAEPGERNIAGYRPGCRCRMLALITDLFVFYNDPECADRSLSTEVYDRGGQCAGTSYFAAEAFDCETARIRREGAGRETYISGELAGRIFPETDRKRLCG